MPRTQFVVALVLEELIAEDYPSVNAWQKKSTELSEIFGVWKTVGPASKKDNEEIWQRFRGAMDTFFAKKKAFFASLKDRQTENLERKTQLCIEAEALMDSTEWKNATEQMKKLQEEWKTIGPVPKRHADKICTFSQEVASAWMFPQQTFLSMPRTAIIPVSGRNRLKPELRISPS